MWFAADYYEDDFQVFDTEKAANNWCKSRIDSIFDEDGWREEEDMKSIFYGEVKAKAVMANKITKDTFKALALKEEWPNDDWEYICDYDLIDEYRPYMERGLKVKISLNCLELF